MNSVNRPVKVIDLIRELAQLENPNENAVYAAASNLRLLRFCERVVKLNQQTAAALKKA